MSVVEYYHHRNALDGSERSLSSLRILEPRITARVLQSDAWRKYEDDLREAVADATGRPVRGSIASRVAADRVQEFLKDSKTERSSFAIRVGIVERTLRNFLNTGRVRRTVLAKIAEEMDTDVTTLCKNIDA